MTFRTWIKQLEKDFYKDMVKYYTTYRQQQKEWNWGSSSFESDLEEFYYPDGEITEYAWNMAEGAVAKLSDKEVETYASELNRFKYRDLTPLWKEAKNIFIAWKGEDQWEYEFIKYGMGAANRTGKLGLMMQLRDKLTAVAGVIIREPMFRVISEKVYDADVWYWWRKKNLKWPNTWGFYHYPED
jgi:hypothetical protein